MKNFYEIALFNAIFRVFAGIVEGDILKQNSFLLIPHSLLTLRDLNPTDKIVFAEVYSLSKNTGYCYASNDYLSRTIGTSDRTITNSIGRLERKGYIKSEVLENCQRKVYVLRDKLLKQDILFPEAENVAILLEKTSHPSEKGSDPCEKASTYNINYNISNKRSYNSAHKQQYLSSASYDIEELMKIR